MSYALGIFWLLGAAVCVYIENWLAFAACMGAATAELREFRKER